MWNGIPERYRNSRKPVPYRTAPPRAARPPPSSRLLEPAPSSTFLTDSNFRFPPSSVQGGSAQTRGRPFCNFCAYGGNPAAGAGAGIPRRGPVGSGRPRTSTPTANNPPVLSACRRFLVRIIIIERTMYAGRVRSWAFVRVMDTVFMAMVSTSKSELYSKTTCLRKANCFQKQIVFKNISLVSQLSLIHI